MEEDQYFYFWREYWQNKLIDPSYQVEGNKKLGEGGLDWPEIREE